MAEFKAKVEQLEAQGKTRQQIADKLQVGISTIRRRLLELEEMQGLRDKKSPSDPEAPEI